MIELDSDLAAATLLYLDPGTGSVLFSVVMGFATAAFFVLKGMYYRGRGRLLKLFGKQHGDGVEGHHSLVIYSEGAQYMNTFKPILDELVARGLGCLYLSSDKDDPLLSYSAPKVKTRHIGHSFGAWGYLNDLQADVCLMTTPGLDVLQLKRSKRVRHYAHLIHSPTDKAFNRPYSFDYFDSVFICGPHQEKTIRHLERIRNMPAKQLLMTGCAYYDYQVATYHNEINKRNSAEAGSGLQLLVAPTWGKNGLLTRFGMQLLTPLLDAGHHVLLRPHPQSFISEPELIAQIRRASAQYTNLIWDQNSSPLEAMQRSDLLISDISGIVFDYCFVTEKPVITLHFEPEKRGFEANDLPYQPWELQVLDVVGVKLEQENIEQLPIIVRDLVGDVSRQEKIRALRQTYVQHFGHASLRVVDELAALIAHSVSVH
jgi:hypothetical protein